MDTFAYGLIVADLMIKDGVLDKFVDDRYASYKAGIGKKIANHTTSFEELEKYTLENGEPTVQSGKQEYLETLINQYIILAGKEI